MVSQSSAFDVNPVGSARGEWKVDGYGANVEVCVGVPYTLGQAQDHISQGPLGRRITWIQQSSLIYLSLISHSHDLFHFDSHSLSIPPPIPVTFDATVLAHSLWYFFSPSLIRRTFRALKQHSKRLLIAEWSLMATHPSAQPHVLAVLAQAALECRKPQSASNVRTVLAPKRIIELALAAGWQLESETRVPSGEGLMDGQWEVSACLSPSFERKVDEQVSDKRERAVVIALRDACEASLEGVEGGRKGVRAMDVWVASFV
jgi:hypothetical protein